MFHVGLDQIKEQAGKGTHLVLRLEISSDVETPISLYHKLCHGEAYSFLLESAEQDARMGRYSFIGLDPVKVVRFEQDGEDNPLNVMSDIMERIDLVEDGMAGFDSGFVGYLGYETIRHFEKISMPEQRSAVDIPEGLFSLPRILIRFDHVGRVINLNYLLDLSGDLDIAYGDAISAVENLLAKLETPCAIPFLRKSEPGKETRVIPEQEVYFDSVKQAKAHIEAGDVFQLVLSQSMQVESTEDSFMLYRRLRQANPSPYMYFLQFEDFEVVGASPETLVRFEAGEMLVRPIAGTRRRGKTQEEDQALEAELLADPKELAEHKMLVDLGRNDVGRVCELGSVRAENVMHVQRFSSVMHLVSDVMGQVRSEFSMFDVFRAAFPAGTLTGAPKIRACELISRLEGRRRGLYGGAVGYFGLRGSMDFAIAIRTMVVKNRTVHAQAGAGVVYDSIPENEHRECHHKAQSCLSIV